MSWPPDTAGSHTRFDLKYHFVWITKYRKKLLVGEVGLRLRKQVRDICSELGVEIIKGHVSRDHVHLFVSCPPHVSPKYIRTQDVTKDDGDFRVEGADPG